jgi:hypothetical protein
LYVGYLDKDGRRVATKDSTDWTATEELARILQRKAERARAGLEVFDESTVGKPLAEALDAWVADLEWRDKSPAYRYNMRLLVNRVAEGCDWRTLGSTRSDALTHRLASPAQHHPSGQSLNQYLEAARAFVNWCCAQRPPWLPANPPDRIEPADETVKVGEKRALTRPNWTGCGPSARGAESST